MHKKQLFHWKIAAIAVLLSMPVTAGTLFSRKAMAETAAVSPAPVFITGTVKQYFTNRAGYVSALSLETVTGVQMVHFAPSWAKRLLANSPVGGTLDGWVRPYRKGAWSWNDLVSIGKDSAARMLNDKIPSGAAQLEDNSWQWKKGKPGTVHGKLKKIVVNAKGDVLALVLDSGALVRVPRTVRNEELGAIGTDAITPLFADVEVTAWGTPEWQAGGDVSIYNQHIAATGLSVNGKTVSAIGIPRLPIHKTYLFNGNINLITARPAEIIGADDEYAPYGPNTGVPFTGQFTGSPRGAHIGHAMLQTADGKFIKAVHQGPRIFALSGNAPLELPMVNGSYLPPVSLPTSKLVMVMDDGRQFEMSSSDGKLYVDLPDGNKSPVKL